MAKTKSKTFEFREGLTKGGEYQFWFVVKAKNGKIIAVSEMYKSKQGRENGAKALYIRLIGLSSIDFISQTGNF